MVVSSQILKLAACSRFGAEVWGGLFRPWDAPSVGARRGRWSTPRKCDTWCVWGGRTTGRIRDLRHPADAPKMPAVAIGGVEGLSSFVFPRINFYRRRNSTIPEASIMFFEEAQRSLSWVEIFIINHINKTVTFTQICYYYYFVCVYIFPLIRPVRSLFSVKRGEEVKQVLTGMWGSTRMLPARFLHVNHENTTKFRITQLFDELNEHYSQVKLAC